MPCLSPPVVTLAEKQLLAKTTLLMRSLLCFSLLLSLSVVDVYEKMVKVQIKIHKEPPDHKMLIKVGLCTSITCYTLDGDVHSICSPSPGLAAPLSPYVLAPSAHASAPSPPSTPSRRPSAHTLRTHRTLTARSAFLSTLSTVHAHNVARKFRTVHRSAPQ